MFEDEEGGTMPLNVLCKRILISSPFQTKYTDGSTHSGDLNEMQVSHRLNMEVPTEVLERPQYL